MDTYIYRGDLQIDYMIVPRVFQQVCFVNPEQQGETLPTLLPDISTWTYVGTAVVHGRNCNYWQQQVTTLNVTATYTMYIEGQRPVQLIMQGYDFLFGSHPDLYILDYSTYYPGFVDEDQFDPPLLCTNSNAQAPSHRMLARTKTMLGLLNYIVKPYQSENVDIDALSFDHFTLKHKKHYSAKERELKQALFLENSKKIETFNKHSDATFTMGLNHFGDMSFEEYQSLILPQKRGSPLMKARAQELEANNKNINVGEHREPTPEEVAALPTSIDWRKLGAVTMVKDQGVCGSCWTFGSAGALEGRYAVAHNQVLIPLSEQQILDCAWGTGPSGDSGCDGGFAPSAFQWIINNGGIALESEYNYLMVDGYCKPNLVSSGVVVTGYVNVTMGSELALQAAVAQGPVAVAIDAAHEEFEFYQSGVYYNPKCGNTPDSLDHEVLVVGYGTDPVGGDYWIVKNSWSTYWGQDGYILMARNRGNNCGIATQATYPVVA
eukprot:TRINITY_DN11217_c0_g1_i1.p1 TRINITY_DN11217_c0_g1~~TRINITY_DN11217_c0_g1_i1.p1  ORF type:complete len:567 (-),score=155.92 TRINITY_DN11217_c0_g1_i1:78-1553(-)